MLNHNLNHHCDALSEEPMLAGEHNEIETHVKYVVETHDEGHDLSSLGELASLVVSYQLCEGPVVDDVGACNTRIDLDVCVHYDQQLVDDEVPSEGHNGRVLVEGLFLDLLYGDIAFTEAEQAEGGQVPAESLE